MLSRTFRAFGYRDFRLMWAGSFTSTTGTWMQTVAQSWVVLTLTNSALYLGLVGFVAELPIILFTLVGGVVADRIDRRHLLLGSQFTQMAMAFVLAALIYAGRIEIWHILVCAAINGTAQSFGGPAYQALVPGLVDKKDLANAIALNSIQFNLARTVGPLLAGVALASLGAAWCFGLNGVSFMAVIATLFLIHSTFAPEKSGASVLADMSRGFAYVKERGALWQLTILGFSSTFLGIPMLTLLPVFARDIFHGDAAGYSIMLAFSGLGSVVGALGYASITSLQKRGMTALVVQGAFGCTLIAFALSRRLWLSWLLLVLGGMFLITVFASITSLVQMQTDEKMRGRVMSIFMLAFRGGMPLGNLTAGLVAHKFSPTLALTVHGIVLLPIASLFLISKSAVKKL
ncbi:MAG: MFS transporter [Acidobacteriota bacterium]